MKQLRIADGLTWPLDTITETIGVLAKRGAGKTHTAVVLGEELLKNNLHTVIVDPVGVWWGLRSSKDGKKNGMPIIIMGGEHGDVPLEHTSGAFVAKLVVEEWLSVLLDLSLMKKSPQRTFVADFAEEVYRLKALSRYRTPMHVVLDEADAFAPQRVHKGMERCLGAVDDLVRRGRARGLGISLITQRSAALNKDVLSQAEILIVLRTTSPHDRKAVEAWTDVHGEEELTKEMMASLPKLQRGQAWIWWPHTGYFKLTQIRDRTTFDSSKTPKVGEKIRKPKNLAPVDIKRIQSQMKDTVERAKQTDPKELKKRILQLEKLVAAKPVPPPPVIKKEGPVQIKRITVPAIGKRTIMKLEKLMKGLRKEVRALGAHAQKIASSETGIRNEMQTLESAFEDVVKRMNEPPKDLQEVVDREVARRRVSPGSRPTSLAPVVKPARRGEPRMGGTSAGNTLPDMGAKYPLVAQPQNPPAEGGIKAERKLLQALYGLGKPATRAQLAILSGLSPGGGTYSNYLGRLRGAGYVHDNGGGIELGPNTPDEEIQPMEVDVTAVQFRWMNILKAERKLLRLLLENGPQSRNALAKLAEMDPGGGTYSNYLGRLRGKGVISRGGPTIEVSPYLIEPAG